MVDYSIIGKRFGRLVVVELDHIRHGGTWWRCICDCGKETVVYRGCLTSGDTISCGCYHNEIRSGIARTHGLSSDPLYIVWSGMNQRCTNPNAKNYERYGGRGIDVCDDWRNDYQAFHNWAISSGYEPGLTLDRQNNNRGYYPDNCRWATRIEQQNNTRRNHLVTYDDETLSLAQWSRRLGVNHETLRYRVMHNNMIDFEKYFSCNSTGMVPSIMASTYPLIEVNGDRKS